MPPSGLIYAVNPAVYTVGTAIVPNAPSVSGGPVASYSISPTLPQGLSIDTSTGVISGTPTAVTSPGAYIVTATNSAGSATAGLSITVNAAAYPPSGLTYSVNPATYTLGTPIAPNMPSSSGGAVTSYSVSPALPAGLSLDTSTGVISGTPTAAAVSATYTVTAFNSAGVAAVGLRITVDASVLPPTGLTYSVNPAVYTVGTAITSNMPSSSGSAVDSYSVSPPLPAGLSLNSSTGVIAGIPTAVAPTATYLVTAFNRAGSTTVGIDITVNAAVIPPSGLMYSVNPAIYVVGVAIAANRPSSSGGAVDVYSVSPPLPVGLSLNTTTGVITGVPTAAAATVAYIVTATNRGGSTTTAVTITVDCSSASITVRWPSFLLADGAVTPSCGVAGVNYVDVFMNDQPVQQGGFTCAAGGVTITGVQPRSSSLITVEGVASDGTTILLRDERSVTAASCGDTLVDFQPAEGLFQLAYFFTPVNQCSAGSYIWFSVLDRIANVTAAVADQTANPTAYACASTVQFPLPVGSYTLRRVEEVVPAGATWAVTATNCSQTMFNVGAAQASVLSVPLSDSTVFCP